MKVTIIRMYVVKTISQKMISAYAVVKRNALIIIREKFIEN